MLRTLTDTIKGSCFAKFDGRMCAMPLMKKLTRTECCCGMEPMGQRGWGQPCQGCPLEGSGMCGSFPSNKLQSFLSLFIEVVNLIRYSRSEFVC